MSRTDDDRIFLCQPDTFKGCSLCCGLFNFRDITANFLSEFLEEGEGREKNYSTYVNFISPHDVRDKFAHICPYQGFLSNGKPGCLIHPLSSGEEGRGRSLFASKICSEFFCPAHRILSVEEKKFLIENVKEWYIYSIAVADPESYSFIYNYVSDNFRKTGKNDSNNLDLIKLLVNEGLSAHGENLASYDGVVFCYSEPEYNLNKKNFSIKYINEKRDLVVSRIMVLASAVK